MRLLFALAIAGVVVPAAIARADLAPPTPANAAAQRGAWLLDDELVTHGPSRLPARENPAPPPAPPGSESGTRAKDRGSDARAHGNFEPTKCAEPEATPARPLEFVDATLETGDLAPRFTSVKPTAKPIPAPRRTKAFHAP